jgi:hypothetical protein
VRRFVILILSLGFLGGMFALSAGAASASVTGDPHQYGGQQQQYGQQHGYGQPVGNRLEGYGQQRDWWQKEPCKPRVEPVVYIQQRQPCKPVVETYRPPCKPVVVTYRQPVHKPCKPVVRKTVCTSADVRAEVRLLERQRHHHLTWEQQRELRHLFSVCGAGRG